MAKQKINISGKGLRKEIAKRMINPYYFSRRYETQYKIILDSHHINHIDSKITIASEYHLSVQIDDVNNILKEMTIILARLINQTKFKCQVVFSAKFDKADEYGFTTDQIEMFISLKVNQNLAMRDIEEINIQSQLDA